MFVSKKHLAFLSALLLVVILVMGGSSSGAWFNDLESVPNNVFVADHLDLVLSDHVSLPFSVSNIRPGSSGEGSVTLSTTAGSMPSKINVTVANLQQFENTCLEPEISAGDPCGAGDLGLGLTMAMFLDVNQDGVYNQGDGDIELEYSGNMNTTPGLQFARVTSFNGRSWTALTLNAGDQIDLVVRWSLPATWSYPKSMEILMTDSLSFDIDITAQQIP